MKIQFLKDTSKAQINHPPNTLCVYREGFGYELPHLPGAEYIEFLEYKKKYMMLEPEMMVIVGLNRIITPSNRCDFINEYMQTMTPNIPKISIDTEPFIGEPWRLWFHYSIANCGKFNITYSYAIETEWQHWFFRDRQDCRLSGDNIQMFISDTSSDLPQLETVFDFEEIDSHDAEWYSEARKLVFASHNTPKLFINTLLKMANRHFNINISFDSYKSNTRFILPDIKIYRFMAEENSRRMKIHNKVISYEKIH